MTINIIITNIVNNTQFSPIPFNVYKRSKRNTKSIKIVIGSSGRSDFQKGKPPGDRHPKFKERIS